MLGIFSLRGHSNDLERGYKTLLVNKIITLKRIVTVMISFFQTKAPLILTLSDTIAPKYKGLNGDIKNCSQFFSFVCL